MKTLIWFIMSFVRGVLLMPQFLLQLLSINLCMGLIPSALMVQAEPKTLIRLGHTSEEVTLNNLRSKVPRGATVTESSCVRIGTGRGYRYRCRIKFE